MSISYRVPAAEPRSRSPADVRSVDRYPAFLVFWPNRDGELWYNT